MDTSFPNEIAIKVTELIDLEFSQENSTESILVLSFHKKVLSLQYNEMYSSKVDFLTFREFISKNKEQDIFLREALKTLYIILIKASARSKQRAIRKSELRTLLSKEKEIYSRRNEFIPPRFISSLVDIGLDAQIIEIDDSEDRINPLVWLKTENFKDIFKINKERTIPPTYSEKKSLSGEYMEFWRKAELGPFSRIRTILYDCLKDALEIEDEKKKTVGYLISKSLEMTKEHCKQNEIEVKNIPWKKVRQFLTRILYIRPVMVGKSGELLVPTYKTINDEVIELTDNYKMDLDGELIVALIEEGFSLHIWDILSLAGALYHERTDESEQRVGELVPYLVDKTRLQYTNDEKLATVKET